MAEPHFGLREMDSKACALNHFSLLKKHTKNKFYFSEQSAREVTLVQMILCSPITLSGFVFRTYPQRWFVGLISIIIGRLL